MTCLMKSRLDYITKEFSLCFFFKRCFTFTPETQSIVVLYCAPIPLSSSTPQHYTDSNFRRKCKQNSAQNRSLCSREISFVLFRDGRSYCIVLKILCMKASHKNLLICLLSSTKGAKRGKKRIPDTKGKIKYYESINNSSSICTRAAHVMSNIPRFYYEEAAFSYKPSYPALCDVIVWAKPFQRKGLCSFNENKISCYGLEDPSAPSQITHNTFPPETRSWLKGESFHCQLNFSRKLKGEVNLKILKMRIFQLSLKKTFQLSLEKLFQPSDY